MKLALCVLDGKDYGGITQNSAVKRPTWPFHSESVRVLNTLSNK